MLLIFSAYFLSLSFYDQNARKITEHLYFLRA